MQTDAFADALPPVGGRPRWSVVLRAVREARGVTLDGWGARIGVSRATVQRWERGARAPDPAAEAAILAYCREMGLFRTYTGGPLAGLHLTAELLQHLLAEARWRTGAESGRPLPTVPSTEAAPAPPLPSPPPTNLPAELTSFIGREDELARMRRVQGGTRLLTLTGAGGCGKTRLALKLVGELRWAYPDGVWFVDLAPLPPAQSTGIAASGERPAPVAEVVASTLAVRPTGQHTLTAALIDALRARRMLLLLDNCEHLAAACAKLVEALLRGCPHLEVLATSREPLGIGGETVWQVPPMSVQDAPVTDAAAEPPAETGAGADAVRLFMERARQRRTDFTLEPGDMHVISDICRRLDGMPLAIELAAARVGALSVRQIADRLHDRFRLLTSGNRTALPRHQTLRATMEWSYQQLAEPEQALLQRLAVFAGGFTLEAVEFLEHRVDPAGAADVIDRLTRLVEKSLVIADVSGGAPRYRLLETVRQFAAEELAGIGATGQAYAAHLAWCLALTRSAEAAYRGPDEAAWLARLEQDHDNLRAALYRARERDEGEPALGIAAALPRFWELCGHVHEGRDLLEQALRCAGAIPDPLRAKALRGLGFLAEMQGRYAEARDLHAQHLAVQRTLDSPRGIAEAEGDIGRAAARQGEYEVACGYLEVALAGHRRDDNKPGIASVQGSLGLVALRRGDYQQARERIEERLTINRAMGNKDGLADALADLSQVAGSLGDSEWQTALLEESLALWRELNSKNGVALALTLLSSAARSQGDHERARALAQESLALARELADTRGIARATEQLSMSALLQGEYAEAAVWCGESLARFQTVGDAWAVGRSLVIMAAATFGIEQPARAARLFGAAAALNDRLGARLPASLLPRYERTLAALRRTLGEHECDVQWSAGQALAPEAAVAEALADAG